jgi:cold shock CspA family protein
MRTHGTLARWNDERGFGFIMPAQAGDEVFVHVSAFPRDGTRPRVGELVSFDIEAGQDGRKRAVRILRPGSRTVRRSREASAGRPAHLASLLGLLAVAAIGIYVYGTLAPHFSSGTRAIPSVQDNPVTAAAAGSGTFSCDGRTRCSQMTSCDEATYFLEHCPGASMDGDGDGIPCEDQWCH